MLDRTTTMRSESEIGHSTTLGHLRLRNAETNEIMLIPTPSTDPNDPLNWSKGKKIYVTSLVCMAMFLCNFLAAGPSVAIVQIAVDFFGPPGPTFTASIAKVAFFFTTTSLFQGLSNLIWMPLAIKYGRRPVYVISFAGYTGFAIMAGATNSYGAELAARILIGFFSGSGECLAPLTITDIWFLHERGFWMASYTCALAVGVCGGIIISGLITISLSWRYIYYIASILIGVATLLVIFTFPETAFNRSPVDSGTELEAPSKLYRHGIEPRDDGMLKNQTEYVETAINGSSSPGQSPVPGVERPAPRKKSWAQTLKLFNGTFTNESFWHIAYRPVVLLAVPSILWATLVMSVTIGFLVAISSNFAPAFAATYNFSPVQSGLCFISGLLFTLAGLFGGGTFSDKVADYFTKRNGGIREPEMRLPAIIVGLITTPLGLILYGVGINNKLHWIVPTLGLGFLNFAIAATTNVSLTYVVDSYRPIAGEAVVTQLGFKSCFGFLLSFYTNPWIAKSGYSHTFGAMAGITVVILLGWIPFYIWGRQLRLATLRWTLLTKTVGWNEDREVGE